MGARRLPRHLRELIATAEPVDTRPRAERMSLVLPFPPSLNNAYPTVRTRQGKLLRVKSPALRQYEAAVRQVVWLWLNHHQVQPPAPPYRLTLVAYPPSDGQKHDASNLVKGPEDCVMAAIGGDDNDVQRVEIEKAEPDGYPRLVLTLETIQRAEED